MIAYLECVGNDYIVSTCMTADEEKQDYVYTKKERGMSK